MNKYYFLIIFFSILSCNTPKKEPSVIETFVYDKEQILTEKQEQELVTLFKNHEKKTSNEIVLVTTSNYGDDKDILFFSVNFGERIGIGKPNKKNGIVIVFSKSLRQVRISNGYAMEKVLKDEISKKIIDSIMIPMFKKDEYYNGLYKGSKYIVEFLELPENEIK